MRRAVRVLLISSGLVLGACGGKDDVATSADDGAAPAVAPPEALPQITPDCRLDEGAAHISATYAYEEAGFPTIEAALRQEIAVSLPKLPVTVPERVQDDGDTTRGADGFAVTARGPGAASVALRHGGRLAAGFSVTQLPSGGWVVDSFTMCNDLRHTSLR